MARSAHIYVLWWALTPIAVFTVKHEAVTYWARKLGSKPNIIMKRYHDGGAFEQGEVVDNWQPHS